ncbi:MAG: ParA family protein [Aigarchaeota archaeon]|nr:ParA family protein [Aigarchaeota archaeon]MDW8092935.1 ParA family protein [Nitrososphaerota archaeon]
MVIGAPHETRMTSGTSQTDVTYLPRHPLRISVANQKGGVGKTSTVVNVAAVLAHKFKMDVLVVDLDPQGHASLALGLERVSTEFSISAALTSYKPVKEIIRETPIDKLHVLPSNEDLAATEEYISRQPGREAVVSKLIESLPMRYDFIIIDTPPNLGVLTFNALYASKFVLVPIQPRYFSIDGLRRLYHVIELLHSRLRAELEVLGHFLTMVDNRYKITHEIRQDLRHRLGESLLRTEIPSSVRLEEGHFLGRPCVIYNPDSPVSKAYEALTVEILERIGSHSRSITAGVGGVEGESKLFQLGVDKTV